MTKTLSVKIGTNMFPKSFNWIFCVFCSAVDFRGENITSTIELMEKTYLWIRRDSLQRINFEKLWLSFFKKTGTTVSQTQVRSQWTLEKNTKQSSKTFCSNIRLKVKVKTNWSNGMKNWEIWISNFNVTIYTYKLKVDIFEDIKRRSK